MHRPNIYETTYAHDRRKHRHRCLCCWKIIDAGERVLMWPIRKGSRAMHIECAEHPTGVGVTFRQLAQLHVDEYARGLGWRINP